MYVDRSLTHSLTAPATSCANQHVQITCPSTGFIQITAQSLDISRAPNIAGANTCNNQGNPGCTLNSNTGGLFLYAGGFNSTVVLVDNDRALNYEGLCQPGDVFSLCEKNGIILTGDALSITHIRRRPYRDSCPAECTSLTDGCDNSKG